MKKECGIVYDLIPLYVDDIASEESRAFVESHIKDCEECKMLLNSMRDNNSRDTLDDEEGVNVMTKISKQWKKDKLIALLSGGAVVSFIVSIVSIIFYAKIGSFVDADGFLQEPFYLVGFFYVFLLISVILTIAILILKRRHKSRIKKMISD